MKTQYIEIICQGTFYYSDKEMTKLHREDGPAVEYDSGSKMWYLNGKLHRENQPAVEFENGDRFWYLNGQLHREDGPAVDLTNGTKFWYLNGEALTEDEFIQRTTKLELTLEEIAAKFNIDPKNLKIKK